MIRVAVLGAGGRMGREVASAVAADPDLSVVAGVDPAAAGEHLGRLIGRDDVDVTISGDIDAVLAAEAEVAVDFTRAEAALENVRWAIDNGVHIVVGTTGIADDGLRSIARRVEGAGSNVLVVPNFAIGAVLMQRFAAEAARHLPDAEIIELHHDGKLDAPSGTALATARRMAEARGDASTAREGTESLEGVRGGDVDGIHIHSVRLPGLVAHQEVIFGGRGQTLTIRHDSMDRTSFMPGVLLAIKGVADHPGLTVGLDALLTP